MVARFRNELGPEMKVIATAGLAEIISLSSIASERFHPLHTGQALSLYLSLVEKESIVDASLKQADRPQYGIELPEVLVSSVTEDFLRCQAPLAFEGEKGDIMYYRALPENQGFRAAADWKRDYRKVAGRIIRRVRENL